MALLGPSALTYGKRKPAPYESDLISEAATRLPALYNIKEAKRQAAEELALQEKGLTQAGEIARLSRESGEKIATGQSELDKALNAASIRSNEAIAGKTLELQKAQQAFAEKQGKISTGISAAGLGLQGYSLLKDAGKIGTGSDQYSLGSVGAGALAGAGTAYALRKQNPWVQAGGAAAAAVGTQYLTSGGGGSIIGDILSLWG